MKATYDEEADAVYMQFSRKKVAKTREMGTWIFADYTASGELIGIEMLNAKKNVPTKILENCIRIDNKE